MIFPSRPFLLGAVAAASALLVAAQPAPPRLSLLGFDAGRPKLSIVGDPQANYLVKSSPDLKQWNFLFTGSSSDGVINLKDFTANTNGPLFYRAQSGGPPLIPSRTVQPLADTNSSAQTIVFTQDGGDISLFDTNGLRFRLNFPSNTIPEPTTVRMTRVTNILGFPFSRGIFGAVRLEPQDLPLFGAATITIIFPPGIDRRQVASFTSANDGTEFHLVPDISSSNHVVIPISRLGTFGSALVTTQEVTQFVNADSVHIASASDFIAQPAPSLADVDCFASAKSRTADIRRQIRDASKPIEEANAAKLSAARQAQLVGDTSDPSVLSGELVDSMCKFYQTSVAPFWTEARFNCPLSRLLLQTSRSLERQIALLGADGQPGVCNIHEDIAICDLTTRCMDEIEQCCLQTGPSIPRVTDALSLARADALSGADCISGERLSQVIDACTNAIWHGVLRLNERGNYSADDVETVTDPLGQTTKDILTHTDQSYHAEFEGIVMQAAEDWLDSQFPLVVYLKVHGTESKKTVIETTEVDPGQGCVLTKYHKGEYDGHAEGDYSIEIDFNPDGSYSIYGLSLLQGSELWQHVWTAAGCAENYTAVSVTAPFGFGTDLDTHASIQEDPLLVEQIKGTDQQQVDFPLPPNDGHIGAKITRIFEWQFDREKNKPRGPM